MYAWIFFVMTVRDVNQGLLEVGKHSCAIKVLF